MKVPEHTKAEGGLLNMKWYIYIAAVALLGCTLLGSSALAAPPERSGFSAMQGVDAQALSVDEMQAISGELNAYDIAASLTNLAASLDKYPKLQAATLKLAAYYTTNAAAINAYFMKIGVYTPPK